MEIGDGTNRAACLSVPKRAITAEQTGRSVELDLMQLGADCASSLPSTRVRIEVWHSAKAPQPSYVHPAWGSAYPDYLIFSESEGSAGMELFIPRGPSSGLRNIACVATADNCWAVAHEDLLFIKWATTRARLTSGLDQDWACIRGTLNATRQD